MNDRMPPPAGFNLPYGVTPAMIDGLVGRDIVCDACSCEENEHRVTECPQCGNVVCRDCYNKETSKCTDCDKLSPCCGTEFDPDTRICPTCKEHV